MVEGIKVRGRRLRGEYVPESRAKRQGRLGRGIGGPGSGSDEPPTSPGRTTDAVDHGRDDAVDHSVDLSTVVPLPNGSGPSGALSASRGIGDGTVPEALADGGHGSALEGGVDDEEIGTGHDLWGPVQWKGPSDRLPSGLLNEVDDRASIIQDDRASIIQEVVARVRDDGAREWPENPDRPWPKPQARRVGGRTVPPPLVPRTSPPSVETGLAEADDLAPAPGHQVEGGPDASPGREALKQAPEDGRLSLSNIRTSSLVIAVTALILLGAAAHQISNSSDSSPGSQDRHAAGSPPPSGRPAVTVGTPSSDFGRPDFGRPDFGADAAPGRVSPSAPSPSPSSSSSEPAEGKLPVRRIVVAPSSACDRFVETSGQFDSVTISVQNACQ